MSKFYGFPYMGSKNKLAKRIVSILPKREHLYDLFCGGCAITHRAMEISKYNHIHINDINPLCTQLFHDALNGKYENEDRWISRDDFHRLKNTDPYVACCFSFGNNFRTYAYSPEIEPKKKALHYAIFFGDYTLAKKELGVDLSSLEKCPTREKKYLLAKRIIKERFDLQSAERLNRITPQYSKKWRFGGYNRQRDKREQTISRRYIGAVRGVQPLAKDITNYPPPILKKNCNMNILSRCQLWIIKMWIFCQTHVLFAIFRILTQGNTQAKARVLTMKGFTLGRSVRQSRCLFAVIGCPKTVLI